MIQLTTALATALLIAATPAVQPHGLVNTGEALAVLMLARAGAPDEADAMIGRSFSVSVPVPAADWTYDAAFGALTYRPYPFSWSASHDPRLAGATGLRINDEPGEPLGMVLAPRAFDWFMGGEGLAAIRVPVTPDVAAEAHTSLRLVIEGQIEPLDGRHAVACGALGEGCILGARIDDLLLIYGPQGSPHVLARWDPAME